KRGTEMARVDLLRAQEGFSTHELIDLQVHFILAWMGFAARREHNLVAELARKERGFTEAEKTQLLDVSRKIAAGIVPRWRAVSPEVLQILASEGVRWCATDQGNLERSELEKPGEKPLHHKPWMCGEVAVFFRDRELSDRVGFRYSKMEAHEAANDLRARIAAAEKDAIVTIALDGENPWEHYPSSGESFLDALYGSFDDKLSAVLPRDEIAIRPPQGRIAKIHSGSWIDSNFRVWIGHAEDNQAWTLLGQA